MRVPLRYTPTVRFWAAVPPSVNLIVTFANTAWVSSRSWNSHVLVGQWRQVEVRHIRQVHRRRIRLRKVDAAEVSALVSNENAEASALFVDREQRAHVELGPSSSSSFLVERLAREHVAVGSASWSFTICDSAGLSTMCASARACSTCPWSAPRRSRFGLWAARCRR